MSRVCTLWAVVAVLMSAVAVAEDYRAVAVQNPPTKEVAPEIAAQLAADGFQVVEGEKKIICEIWPTKAWSAKEGFEASDSVLYGIEPGTLVGVLRFPRGGADFRGQEIPGGVYTLRYANQPVDGNHVGTFPTRDFLVMIPARVDKSTKAIADAELFKASMQSGETTHPAIMPLVKPEGDASTTLRQVDGQEWWTLRVPGKDGKGGAQALEVIVVGKAAE